MDIRKLSEDEVLQANILLKQYQKYYERVIPPILNKLDYDYRKLSWWKRLTTERYLFETFYDEHFKLRLLFPDKGLDNLTTAYSLSTLLNKVGLLGDDVDPFKLCIVEAIGDSGFSPYESREAYYVPFAVYYFYKSILKGEWYSVEN